MLDIVFKRDIYKSFNFYSCLDGVQLEVFKKLGYCTWFSRIVLCTKSGSLSLDSF